MNVVLFKQIHKEEVNIDEIALINGSEIIEEVKNIDNSYTFSNLLSNKKYLLQTSYSYTIVENGIPLVIKKMIETTVKTDERPIPTIEFIDLVVGKEDVSFNLIINDTVISEICIYKDGLLVKNNISVDSFYINGLLSNNAYEIIVTYEYDLKDGNPKGQITSSYEFKTLEKTAPKVVLTSCIIFGDMLSVWFNVTDVEKVVNILGFEVYNSLGEKVAAKETADHFNVQTNDGDISFAGIT